MIAKLTKKIYNNILYYSFEKVLSSELRNTYDKALEDLDVMSDDGIFTIIECYRKENGR